MNQLFAGIQHYLIADDFYDTVREKLQGRADQQAKLTVGTIDIDHFNYINDLLGFEIGDGILQKIAEHFAEILQEGEYFTRLHADIFAFCVHATEIEEVTALFSRLIHLEERLAEFLPPSYQLTTTGGAFVAEEMPPSVSVLLDKANYARQKAKNQQGDSFSFYDAQMHEEQQWQKSVTLSMESALQNREFEMYLQPKIAIKNNQIAGAEALVRWNHPQKGRVFPDRFIPAMEQCGFIQKLDFFMLEEACRFLRKCEAIHAPQMPISVNFSKVHLANPHLVDEIFHTVHSSGIHTSMIEIEFTESIFIESFDRLVEIVSDLKLLGFRVSLDDFGSAYSSLNCLKELPIDIIKIDKGFLQASAHTEKGQLIIAKVVEMIKSLRMLSIMEGVETLEHVEFLRKVSCDFAQGYFYARPMESSKYLEYLEISDLPLAGDDYTAHIQELESESYLETIPQEFQMDNWELYTLGKNIDMGLMKGYLDGDVTVQYVNDCALEYLGYTRQEFREIFHNSILAFTHPEDVPIVQKNAEQLIQTGVPLHFQTRAIRKDGRVITLQGRSSCVIDDHGRPIGLYAFQDVTEELEQVETLQKSLTDQIEELEAILASEREARESLYLSEERYRAIVEQSDDVMFDWDFATDVVTFSDQHVSFFGSTPQWENPRKDPDIRSKVHPMDIVAFQQWLEDIYQHSGTHKVEFRILDLKGDYIWTRCNATVIQDSEGKPQRAVGLLSNINAQKSQLDALTYKSQRDPLTKALNREELSLQVQNLLEESPETSGAFFMIDIDNFKALNDNLGHQLGDTVLMEFTQKLGEVLPHNSLVGRMGGDEFGAYLQGAGEKEACYLAEQLVVALRLSYYGSMEKYNISASVGVSLYPHCGKTFAELYHCADIALYESKRKGKDCYTLHQKEMTGSLMDNRTPVEWSDGFLNIYFQEDFPFKIFEMLYETKDIHASIDRILKLLGDRFQMDRVYIFQKDPHERYLRNSYEWCGADTPSVKDSLQRVPLEELQVYLEQYSKEGVYCCPDIRKAPPKVYEICLPQGIKSMLHCAIHNEGRQMGFIGFDMCSTYHEWTGEEIAILGYISRILSVFLLKSEMSQELETTYQNYAEMVENLSGFVYVVDPETYELLYINKATKALGVDEEALCYQMAFGIDVPCANCPMKQFDKTTNSATVEIYSQILQRWISASASKIGWKGRQNAGLVCCTDISKYKKDPPPLGG